MYEVSMANFHSYILRLELIIYYKLPVSTDFKTSLEKMYKGSMENFHSDILRMELIIYFRLSTDFKISFDNRGKHTKFVCLPLL